ncbi:MAG: aminoacyl-tRNA hydrolase [Spirochaetales bacterium]|nr:aminoacyl-tRNA hydrolase [Spirochaetales bacterium]
MERQAFIAEILAKTEMRYTRSGGPGGQNVNKRDTKAEARLHIDSLILPGEVGRSRIHRRLAHRITTDGYLVIQADGERSQGRNREEALQRITNLLLTALKPDAKPRRPTKPGKGARERRLASKKRRSTVKQNRSRPTQED